MSRRRRKPPKVDVRVVVTPDAREQGHRRRIELLAVVSTLAALVALIPVIRGMRTTGHSHAGHTGGLEAARAVSVEELVVDNGASVDQPGDAANPGGEQTLASSPGVDVTLLNSGSHRVLVTGVRVEVLDTVDLPSCYAQGGGPVPVSAHYAIKLPALPRVSERTIRRPLHEEIPPDDVDRFVVRFGLTDLASALDSAYLYAVRVTISLSGGRKIGLGRFVIALPGAFEPSEALLPIDPDFASGAQADGFLAPSTTWCYLRNLVGYNRLIREPGRRSQELAGLRAVSAVPTWVERSNRLSPRSTAKSLLRRGDADDARLALFAAVRTGDQRLITSVRAAAARRLVVLGRQALKDHWQAGADFDARASLAMLETPLARDLLSDIEGRAAR